MLDILKENDKIDSVWCTLHQFLEIGVSRFMIAGLWPGIWDLRLMAFYLLNFFTAGMVTRQVFMLIFHIMGLHYAHPLGKGLF